MIQPPKHFYHDADYVYDETNQDEYWAEQNALATIWDDYENQQHML